jgi:hypothetical protein
VAELLKKELSGGDRDRAGEIVQGALGIAVADAPDYVFPKT